MSTSLKTTKKHLVPRTRRKPTDKELIEKKYHDEVARPRHQAAQLDYLDKEGICPNLKIRTMDEYIKERGKIDPDIFEAVRAIEMKDPNPCKYCESFKNSGFAHCLHCGKLFEED